MCADQASAFSIDAMNAMAKQDTECTNDYILISGTQSTTYSHWLRTKDLSVSRDTDSSAECNLGINNLAVDSKYCGQFLSTFPANVKNTPICGNIRV